MADVIVTSLSQQLGDSMSSDTAEILAYLKANLPTKSQTNFIEYAYKVLKAKEGKKKSIKIDYRNVKRFFQDFFKDENIENIKKTDIERLHTKISLENGAVQANRIYSLVHSIFESAVCDELIQFNPCRGIKKNVETPRAQYLDSKNLARFFIATSLLPTYWKNYFFLLIYTGARGGNVRAMKWECIDFASNIWTIPANEAKGGKKIEVMLTKETLICLQEMQDINKGSEFVFPAKSKSGHMQEPKKIWAKIKDDAGLQTYCMHDLRATLATWQDELGSDISVISKTLGHADAKTTKRYIRNKNKKELSAVLESVGKVREHFSKFALDNSDWVRGD